jgi:hypothetical protein
MASAFDTVQNVIRFDEPHWPDGRKPHWLLWPVWVRRVAAPSRPGERIGPFERAVLGCARAQISDPEHIGGLLQIDKKLVTIIQQSLIERGSLEGSGSLSSEGKAALEAGEVEDATMNVVHVFQCALTGLVLPRVSEDLEFAEFHRRGDRWQIERGSIADPKPTRCFPVLPKDAAEPPIPDANEVLAAIRRHFADQRAIRAGAGGAQIDREDGYRPTPKALKRVEVIDVRARPMFLATIAYAGDLEAGAGDDDWRIADPFGLGESSRMLDAAERLRRSDPQFDSRVRELFASASEARRQTTGIDPSEVWRDAQRSVAAKLPSLPPSWPGIQHLVTMEESSFWAGLAESVGQKRARLRNCAQAARSAAEACFTELQRHFPFDSLRTRLQPRGRTPIDATLLRGMLVRASMTCGMGATLPRRFEGVKPADLVSVVFYNNAFKLSALIMATVLVAERQAAHPLHRAALERPDVLDDLDWFLSIAGGASHDSGGPGPTDAQVEQLIGLVYWLLKSMLVDSGVGISERKDGHA